MTFKLVDRVRETSISPGTATAVLAGAALGYQTFSAGVGANNTTYYVIADQSGANWEVGYGTVGALGTTLARTTVLSSSNGGSLVNFTSGTQDVWVDYPATKAVFQDSTGTVSVPVLLTNSTTSTTPNLSFNASNTGLSAGATISGNYLQAILQNKSGTAGSSTNYVLSNDLGTDSTYYGEFGMNSSVFSASTPADFFSINNGIYFSGHDGDLSIGSGNGFKTYLAWGTTGQSAHVINASGALGFSTNLGTTPALSGTTGYGTSGQALISGGNAAPPAWGTLGVNGGGTGLTSLTAGYIPYGNGSSALSSSSALYFSGSQLGVGTAGSPAATIHALTASGTNIRAETSSTTSYAQHLSKADNDAVLAFAQFGSAYASTIFGIAGAGMSVISATTLSSASPTGLAIGSTANVPLYFATNNTVKMRLFASGGLALNGTTDPGIGAFYSSITGGSNLYLEKNTGAAITFQHSTTTDFVFNATTSAGMDFFSGSTRYWQFNSSGNIVFANNTSQQIRSSAAGYAPILADNSGNTISARAWVNFDGTVATPTIRASFNVSSVVRNDVGNYTINFTNAMPDTSFVATGSTIDSQETGSGYLTCSPQSGNARTTSSVSITTRAAGQARVDTSWVQVLVFR